MVRNTRNTGKYAEGSAYYFGEDNRSKLASTHLTRHRLVRIAAVLFTLLLLALMIIAWVAFRADQVKSNLEAAADVLPRLQTELVSGDGAAAQRSLDQLQSHTTEARRAGTDPLWRAASIMPILGPNLSAITEVTVSADDIVQQAVAPMLGRFDSLDWDSLTPDQGRIDVAPLQEVSPTLAGAARTTQLSYERLEDIDREQLFPEVANPLLQAIDTMDGARRALNSAAAAAEVLPPMLGADGPRTYLVLIQNSAEIRATGGISGAYALIRTDAGSIELIGQGSGADLGRFDPPIEVDAEQERIYSSQMGTFFQSTNLTPDFPTVATTAQAMWERRNPGSTIDGVIALDAVVLADILASTGPVELAASGEGGLVDLIVPSGLPTSLTSENVVPTLLSDVYARIEDPAVQDEYFASVAGQVFTALAEGQGDSAGIVDSLRRSSQEQRLYVWSDVPAEQDVIGPTALGGRITGPSKDGAAFGVYFNDGTGAKMDYYVERTVQLIGSCTTDGSRGYTVRVTMTNTAPADAAESLPAYVTGAGAFGVEPGTVRTDVVGYGPERSALGTATVDGAEVPVASFLHGDRPVGVITTHLAPQQTTIVDLPFVDVSQEDEPAVSVTPTVQRLQDVLQTADLGPGCS
ncbi:DUF4012 domain-containing protein [Arthrobacter sp. N1]|uniref:DUF4012 domain-containing protein n=1 Tax=Arthrobacter sp. N1 TaxID=619291 RepID=UPI003BAFF692